jgi:hypothetical protein
MQARPLREVALPALGLSKIRLALREEVGPVAAVHALHSAGFAAGAELFQEFQRTLQAELGELPEPVLWERLAAFFRQRGWGSLGHRRVHPGVGLLESPDWAEAVPHTEEQPQCAFSTGLLSNFLTLLAGSPVAVLEVRCRSRGDDACSLAFGSEATIQRLYERLLEGDTLDEALQQL